MLEWFLGGMKLLSWNVNGLRAAVVSGGLKQLLDLLGADIICLQETKITRDLLEEPLAIVEGYNSYFSFSRTRSGYSGVATFCKADATPEAAEEGLSGLFTKHDGAVGCYGNTDNFTLEELQALDSEGRAMITRHCICTSEQRETTLTVINVYCPRADPEKPERGDFKLRFFHLLQARAEALLRAGGHVVILGDINTAHKPIDHCDPGELEEAYTCWCNVTGSRHLNYGTRIDYILADSTLVSLELVEAQVMPEVRGSDHCPVQAMLKSVCLAAPCCPPLCTRFLPEFAGTQQKLSRFLVKVDRTGLPEKDQKQREAKPLYGRSSKKARTGPLQKGQGDLRRFFKAGSLRDSDGAGCQAFMHRAAERNSAKGTVSTERPVNKCRSEKVAGMSEEHLRSLGKEPAAGLISGEATNSGEGVVPSRSKQSASLWKTLLSGPAKPPQCKAHGEPCVLRTVKKQGPNCGRRFYVCAQPLGKPSDPRARCNFFLWADQGNP
ncbi:DNA-(apurinic or apyrimidinic site) endonuclease 2 isoform X2 [Varanus komodoensis]|uniref:DNA-(apurinic or apyrimidinic site) endonuclease 2 isoform X2 n=1 Tax=Varanus komodoensis TaxID=61221 RepID=UPI001CF7E816|nr:DNA-(apurinic or apyrimidinic site) endonuclease 2 isoform X2 [Varanus komodoensis]